MELDQIFQEWSVDAVIDPLEPGLASIRVGVLHSKWLTRLAEERMSLKRLRAAEVELRSLLKSYYRCELTKEDLDKLKREPYRKKLLKGDVEDEVNADKLVIQARLKIGEQEEKVSALEEILKNLSRREFQVSNHIKWRALVGGRA